MRLFVALLLVLPFAVRPAAPEPAANLLRNGDFEEWAAETGPPPGWQFVVGQSPGVLQKETRAHKSGAASVRLDLGAPNNIGWLAQTVEGTHPDTEYRITGWVKVGPGWASSLPLVMEPNLGGLDLPAKQEWTPFEWVFNSQEATKLVPQFRFRGNGSIWLDDVRLVQAGAAGASVLPERRQLLQLLEYQAHPADPKTNDDAWTRPLVQARDARSAFAKAGPAGWPRWKVGQWARYLCRDDLLVPSVKPEKRRHIALVECAVVGQESVGGKPYYWYQSVVRLERYWVARSTGLYDSGEKVLLATPRKVVLSLLVDGPEFRDVRRYQLKVDGEPLLEYTDGERAVLPRMNVDHALIPPMAQPPGEAAGRAPAPAKEGATTAVLPSQGPAAAGGAAPAQIDATTNSRVPAAGITSLTYHGPQLDREATLVAWGEEGAKDERGGEKPVVLRLARPPYIAVSFDGFGEVRHYQEMLAAGAELFQGQRPLYLGEARRFFNTLPAFFFSGRRWDVDVFDVCRGNLLGFSAHLDEPYQRQRKPNEYVQRGQAKTVAEAAERYSAALAGLLKAQPVWPGEEVMDYNSPASAAWYSARVGAAGFVLENARLPIEMADIQRVTGQKDARALADEINIACLAGASRRFGTWWGQGIYRWVPQRFWQDELVTYAERGARYLGFWIEGGEIAKDGALSFYESVRKALPEIARAVKAVKPLPRVAKAVIVVPNGYVVGLAGSAPETPWGIVDLPEGKRLTDDVLAQAGKLVDQGVVFDIVVDDPRHPPALAEYERVIRVGY